MPNPGLRFPPQRVQRFSHTRRSAHLPSILTAAPAKYLIQPALDVPAFARFRYPAWLQSLYNIAQKDCTTLDPTWALCLVSLPADWDTHAQNIVRTNIPEVTATTAGVTTVLTAAYTQITVRPRPQPLTVRPVRPPRTAAAKEFDIYKLDLAEFKEWMDAETNVHAAIVQSFGPFIVQNINNTTPLGIASLSCMDVVLYISKNSVIPMQEINTVKEALQSPMTHFDKNLREHLGIMAKNFQYLAHQKHVIPHLTQLRYLEASLRSFTQFSSIIATWKEKNNDISSRTFDSLQTYLLEKIGNIPSESNPRGGHAFNARGRGKGKKGKGCGSGRGRGDGTHFVGAGSYHQGYRAAIQNFNGKPLRSPSPEVEHVPSPASSVHPATAFRFTGLDRDNDTHKLCPFRQVAQVHPQHYFGQPPRLAVFASYSPRRHHFFTHVLSLARL